MAIFLGSNTFGETFGDSLPNARNIRFLEGRNAIFDEVHLKEDANNINVNKERWGITTRLLAMFREGDRLSAGNILNDGIKIEKFIIKRRRIGETNNVVVGEAPYIENQRLDYIDYTQSNEKHIYSIVPLGENGIEGRPNEVEVESDFVGWWVVDKDENNVDHSDKILAFDMFTDSNPMVSTQLNTGRTVIDTFSKYPHIFHTNQSYNSFSLTATFVPEEWDRGGKLYERMIQDAVINHKPMIVKSSDGRIYVCEVSNPQMSNPQNSYKQYDYVNLTLDFTEIMDYEEYMNRGE